VLRREGYSFEGVAGQKLDFETLHVYVVRHD